MEIDMHTASSDCSDPSFEVESKSLPSPWAAHIHPRGWLYFSNPACKAVTDQDVRDPQTLEIVERTIAKHYPPGTLGEGMEIHLHPQRPVGEQDAASDPYNLVVNHQSCVASYQVEHVTPDSVPSLSPARLNRLRLLYWNYLWNHPSHVPTPERSIKDASDALAWFHTDNITLGASSTIPFSKAECEELSRMVRELSSPVYCDSTAKTLFLSWFLREVASFRRSESYGEYTYRDAVDRKNQQKRPPLAAQQTSAFLSFFADLAINTIFFGIPHTYRAHIKTTSEYRGRLSDVQREWNKYIERLVREYSHFLLISTVLLSATVGFMSIENLPEVSRVAASISALTSMSSIITGVFSIWQHQVNASQRHSYTYMHNVQHSLMGVRGHAVLLGLPASLLVWAIIAFTVAIITYTVRDLASTDAPDRISAYILLAIFFILFLVVCLSLHVFSIIWTLRTRSWMPRIPPLVRTKKRKSSDRV
ncbi:hypothetical protein BKA70DRAFT_1258622 [Coprinopsis sp. MPI-PUGE-AT-0042]|nr:hypothetical protein BKA70DRAFT_1258622 [Coprinopsis sp. MPI-PUGE-AT-0042]